MTKPDWAERLQRTFNRKYNEGIQAERKRILDLLKIELPAAKRVGAFYAAGIERAIEIVNEDE